MDYGRRILWTDVPEVTSENIIEILQDVIADHNYNASRCNFLMRYEAGNQPLVREKTYRSDINIEVCDNIANEITEFKTAFNWGNPITLVQRGTADSGSTDEPEAITLLNECYEAEEIDGKTQQLARYVEICGIGYTLVEINTDVEDGDSYFKINVLAPQTAFVVRSSYYTDHRIMIGVSFRIDRYGNRHFTCFTRDRRFEVLNLTDIENGVSEDKQMWKHDKRSGEENPLHRIPVTEWIRSHDRMGCFERQIPEMDNLNLLISDFSNDVDQNTQAIWHGNDIDFPTVVSTDSEGNQTETLKYPQTNDWILTQTTQDGKTPFVNPLAVNYDYEGMLNNIVTRRALILEKCNVPARNDDSGGSTGIAMSQATGLANAEYEATKQDQIKAGCKMEEVKSVLAAIRASAFVPQTSPLLSLRYMDVQPNIKRQKNFEMTTKLNAFATGVSHGIAPDHMFSIINLFDDPHQVSQDSKPYMEMYLNSIYNPSSQGTEAEPDRLEQDESDQIGNSPFIDGARVGSD